MVLFLLVSIPLAYFFVLGISGQSNQSRKYTLLAVVRGAIWAVPAIGILAILRSLIGTGYSVGHLYLVYGVGEVLAPILVGALGLVLLERPALEIDLSVPLTSLTSFLAGYLGLLNLFEVVRHLLHFDMGVLFVLPLVRVAFLMAIPLLFLLAVRRRDSTQYIAIVVGTGALALFSWIPTLYYLSFQLPAVLLSLTVACGAGIILPYLGKQNLPGR